MRNIITLSQLKVAGACADALRRFATAFGESTPVTLALACKHADQFNWDWAADNLLSAAAQVEYDQAVKRAQVEFDQAVARARAEYVMAATPAWTAYDRAVAPPKDTTFARARAECREATALPWATYTEAVARARAEYATVFLFARGKRRKAITLARLAYARARADRAR